jgi:quercetin dioxygenase-like cupin family protein
MAMKFISIAGDSLTILLEGVDTGGVYTVMESRVPPGGATPPHTHHREDEAFLVMDGELTFFVGGEKIVRKKNEYLFAPRGIPHQMTNASGAHATVIITASPAGIEHFFEAVGTPLASREEPGVKFTPAAIEHMMKVAPEFGIIIA